MAPPQVRQRQECPGSAPLFTWRGGVAEQGCPLVIMANNSTDTWNRSNPRLKGRALADAHFHPRSPAHTEDFPPFGKICDRGNTLKIGCPFTADNHPLKMNKQAHLRGRWPHNSFSRANSEALLQTFSDFFPLFHQSTPTMCLCLVWVPWMKGKMDWRNECWVTISLTGSIFPGKIICDPIKILILPSSF